MVEPKIKIDLERKFLAGQRIAVELGCGPSKQPGHIGIDRLDLPAVDIVADINDGFPYFPDRSVDEIHSRSVLEHVENLEFLMRETCRVLKKGGRHYCFVPHFSNPYYYSDYTHSRFFGLYTFYYFAGPEHQLRHSVPSFYTDVRIRIVSVRLIFQSIFRGVNFIKKLIEKMVNSSSWMQEFYEENLCTLIPCYGVEVVYEPA